MRWFVFALLALLGQSLAVNSVYTVTDDNYESLFPKYSPTIVYFDSTDPTPQIQEFLESMTHLSHVGFVNCKKHESPCLDYIKSVKNCPAFMIIDRKLQNTYSGDTHDLDTMRQWARSAIIGNSVVINNVEDAEIFNEGSWLVNYFAAWSAHSRKLAPGWVVASNVAEGISFAQVDCSDERLQEYCKSNNIDSYPTIRAFKDGEVFSYSGSTRFISDILEWGYNTLNIKVPFEEN